MEVWKFEDRAWKTDRIRVVVRAPATAQIDDYSHKNAAEQGMSVTKYLKVRIAPKVGPFESVVVDSSGAIVHGGTKLKRVRDSYRKE